MQSAENRIYVERRPDGHLQWVQELPHVEQRRNSGAWVRESRRRRNYPTDNNDSDGVVEMLPERIRQENRLRQNLPSAPQVENLLGIYVATGEGRGAYIVAKQEEKKEDDLDRRRRRQSHSSSRLHDFPPFSPWSSGDESDDDHDDDGLGGKPPRRGPGGGGPSSGPPEVYIVERDERLRRDTQRADNRVWIPLQMNENGRRRFLRADEYDPARHEEYHPFHRGAAYFNDRPRPIPRRGSSHAHVRHDEEPAIHSRPEETASSVDDFQEIIIERVHGTQHPVNEVQEPPPPPAPPEMVHIQEEHRHEQPREPHRPQRRHEVRGPPRPTVEEVSDDEDDAYFGSLPPEEDDIHIQSQSRRHPLGIRPRGTRINRTRTQRDVRMEQSANARRSNIYRVVGTRGGYGSASHDIEEDFEDVFPLIRMRGGGPENTALGKTSSVGAGVLEDYSITSKLIFLYFFNTSKGKIISSRKPEEYRTFQELRQNQPVINPSQLSDQWLVTKLQEHYGIITRRQQNTIWDLLVMRTIGFATFIRFQRAVKKREDFGNFIVTAKVPAISSENNAVSQFLYSMKYPLRNSKMMLFPLDRLAGMTKNDTNCFYVVEIKETFDTGKIYTLLILLILVSSGAGSIYAILQSDISTGLSIATYVLTCLSLILALVAAGEWLGLSKPDSFSFAYSLEKNRVLSSADAGRIFGLT